MAKPNIVVITLDDASVPVVNAGLGAGLLPNIKTYLIDQGSFFTRNYPTYNWCCPSRATFLSGQYTHNHGCWTNSYPYGGATLFDDSNSLPVWLQAAGYRTGLVGRWLNVQEGENPNSPKDDATYVPFGWESYWGLSGYPGPETVYNYRLTFRDGSLHDYGAGEADYLTYVLSGFAQSFVSDADERPFFLWFTPTAPHVEGTKLCDLNNGWTGTIRPAPRHVGSTDGLAVPHGPAFNEADVSDKPGWFSGYPLLTAPQQACLDTMFRHQVASLRAVDDMVGDTVAALTASGKLANTWIFFTSDNGYEHGDHRLAGKRFPYEGMRVPLYVRNPASLISQTISKIALNNDLAPTICELAGATAGRTMDGRSLVPLILNPSVTWRKRFYLEAQSNGPGVGYTAIRTDVSALTTPNVLYAEYTPSGAKEFYVMTADPNQLVSKHADPAYATQRAELAGLLTSFATSSGATCRSLEDA